MRNLLLSIVMGFNVIVAFGQQEFGVLKGSEAVTIEGKVLTVTHGNTFTLSSGDKKYLVRIIGIDVPLHSLKSESRDNLSRLIKGKDVKVVSRPVTGSSSQQVNFVGKVLLGSQDVAIEQIRSGLAWESEEFAEYQNAEDRLAYSAAVGKARESKLGVWSDTHKECKVNPENASSTSQSTSMGAKATHKVTGVVVLDILVDEKGKVASATAKCGHPVLQTAAVKDVYQRRFEPTRISGQAVNVSGFITYNFVLEESDSKKVGSR